MAVEVIEEDGKAVMYCNTSMWGFGPVFDSKDEAFAFKYWLDEDPRRMTNSDLEGAYHEWLDIRDEKEVTVA